MMRARLGISELYSSLILLIIISTMGSIVYSYTLDTTIKYENHFSDQNNKEIKRIFERIEIVSILSTNQELNISVYNYGDFNSSIDTIYINDTIVDVYYNGIDDDITPYEIKNIVFLSPVSINIGELYNIKIVSKYGVVEILEWKK